MASLWNKLTLSTKTNLAPSNGEEPQKRTRKQSLSARSRKSLAQIFPNLYDNPSDDKENALTADSDLKCEEAGNYPLYDAENPEHNTAYHPPTRKSRSLSLLKEQIKKGNTSLRSKSPSPTRMLTSSRKALGEFANLVKTTAADMSPLTTSTLLRDMCPTGRSSEKSVKSVHWRSSESTTLTKEDGDIPEATSPTLPNYICSDHFLGSKILLTSMPPPTLIFPTLAVEEPPTVAAEELPTIAVEEPPPVAVEQLPPGAVAEPSPVGLEEPSPVAVKQLPTVAAEELPTVVVEDTDTATNMTHNSIPLEDPFADPSDESMSIVDETEDSQETCQELLDVENGRVRTPSPAGISLPESPMPQKF